MYICIIWFTSLNLLKLPEPGFPKIHFIHSKLSRLTVQQYAITGKRSKYSTTILGSPQPPILNLTVFFSVSSPSVVYLLSTYNYIRKSPFHRHYEDFFFGFDEEEEGKGSITIGGLEIAK